jgi:hypothetical protein
VDGILMTFMGVWGGVIEKYQEELVPSLRWVMVSRLDYGTTLWCGDQALEESFPVLYSIGHIKDALVVDYLELSSSSLLINNNNKRYLVVLTSGI